MFFPHFASIEVIRQEPLKIHEDAIEKILMRNEDIASRIVIESYLRGDSAKPEKEIRKKINNQNEIEIRIEFTRNFMILWNHWRNFYFDAPPVQPKNRGQLTQIENIIQLAEEKEIKLTLLIGSTHKAFVWRKVRPSFPEVISKGIEHYNNHSEEVIIDLDRLNYREKANG